MEQIERNILTCLRCGHVWMSQRQRPATCAKCKRQNWWKPKRIPQYRWSPDPLNSPGRPDKYKVGQIEVGQEKLYPWSSLPNGYPDVRAHQAIHRAVIGHAKRYGKKFYRFPTGKGILVRRIE